MVSVVPSSSTRVQVSVVLPAHNASAFIDEALASVVSQTMPDWEALVIDDGSVDDTARCIRGWCARDQRIRLLCHPDRANLGVAKTRALGIREARGDLVAFLDADDRFAPEKLARQLSVLAAHPEAVMCHTRVRPFGTGCVQGDSERWASADIGTSGPYELRHRDDWLRRDPICNSSALARRECIDPSWLEPPQIFQYEDWLLYVMLSGQGPFVYLDEPLADYRVHEASATAKIVDSDLWREHSHLEFLLTLAALSDWPAGSPEERDWGDAYRRCVGRMLRNYGGQPHPFDDALLRRAVFGWPGPVTEFLDRRVRGVELVKSLWRRCWRGKRGATPRDE